MRRVPGRPDRLISSAGDSVYLTPGGGHMWFRSRGVQGVATLENVRSTGRDRSAGAWTCAADFVLAPMGEAPGEIIRGPIEYRSEVTEGRGPRRHAVRVIPAGPGS